MSKCVQEKLASDTGFKLNDFGDEAVSDIFERLKEKRTMSNKEITYLKELINRAIERHQHQQCLVNLLLICIQRIDRVFLDIVGIIIVQSQSDNVLALWLYCIHSCDTHHLGHSFGDDLLAKLVIN